MAIPRHTPRFIRSDEHCQWMPVREEEPLWTPSSATLGNPETDSLERMGHHLPYDPPVPSSPPSPAGADSRAGSALPRLLVTAGPTQEPIDAVRYIGNRSSGRLGVALAREAARRGWNVCLLIGPACCPEPEEPIRTLRFQTTTDLQNLLRQETTSQAAAGGPAPDIIIMAAAVADFRPRSPSPPGAKLRRQDRMILELEPTPDLLADLATRRRPGQLIVGFALEPRASLLASAQEKLERKGVDLIVANPLETMDSPLIEAVILERQPTSTQGEHRTPGPISKDDFAPWLLDFLEARLAQARREEGRING